MNQSLLCIHEIVAEWCHTCKYENPLSIKEARLAENLSIASNLDTWVKKPRTT